MVYKLIDFDAAVSLSAPGAVCGLKYTSGFVPPEMVHIDVEGKAVVREVITSRPLSEVGYEYVSADTSYDMWSLGVVLYNLCTG